MDKKTKEELKEQRRAQEQERQKKEQKSGMVRNLFVWLGVLIFLGIGGYAIVKTSGTANTTSPDSLLASTTTNVPPVTKSDNVLGPTNAKVTIVEYGDFQCPACGAFYPLVKQLESDFKGKIRIVYRYFPLTNLHPNAMLGAEAAYAAAQQGKFWDMHDMLYSTQTSWADLSNADAEKVFDGYAQKLKLDTDKFTQDVHSKEAAKTISDSINSGVNTGVNATPTFYIDNKFLTNPAGYESFKTVVANELSSK